MGLDFDTEGQEKNRYTFSGQSNKQIDKGWEQGWDFHYKDNHVVKVTKNRKSGSEAQLVDRCRFLVPRKTYKNYILFGCTVVDPFDVSCNLISFHWCTLLSDTLSLPPCGPSSTRYTVS